MNAITTKAHHALTTDWQPFRNLKAHGEFIAYETLCWMGKAEMQVEQLTANGCPVGSRHYFRLKAS